MMLGCLGVFAISSCSREAAQKLGLSQNQVRYLLAKGEIEGKKLSRDWVVLSLDYERKRKPKTKKRGS